MDQDTPRPDPDPRGVIAEAYRLPDPGEAECRSIFLDWVLGLAQDADVAALAADLLSRSDAAEHPMSAILRSAMVERRSSGRRGGRSRVSGAGPRPRKPAR